MCYAEALGGGSTKGLTALRPRDVWSTYKELNTTRFFPKNDPFGPLWTKISFSYGFKFLFFSIFLLALCGLVGALPARRGFLSCTVHGKTTRSYLFLSSQVCSTFTPPPPLRPDLPKGGVGRWEM